MRFEFLTMSMLLKFSQPRAGSKALNLNEIVLDGRTWDTDLTVARL